jgi:hypothetical protein
VRLGLDLADALWRGLLGLCLGACICADVMGRAVRRYLDISQNSLGRAGTVGLVGYCSGMTKNLTHLCVANCDLNMADFLTALTSPNCAFEPTKLDLSQNRCDDVKSNRALCELVAESQSLRCAPHGCTPIFGLRVLVCVHCLVRRWRLLAPGHWTWWTAKSRPRPLCACWRASCGTGPSGAHGVAMKACPAVSRRFADNVACH